MKLSKLHVEPAAQAPGKQAFNQQKTVTWFTDADYDLELVQQTKDEPAHFRVTKDDETIHIPYQRSKGHVFQAAKKEEPKP